MTPSRQESGSAESSISNFVPDRREEGGLLFLGNWLGEPVPNSASSSHDLGVRYFLADWK